MRVLRGAIVFLVGAAAVLGASWAQEDAARFVSSGAAGGFVEIQQLEPSGPDEDFGVAMDRDGDTLVVGADGRYTTIDGAVYVYDRDPLDPRLWVQTARLVASGSGQQFGDEVAISGDTIVVGQWFTSTAHVFERDPSTQVWELAQVLTRTNRFGDQVEVSGDTMVISASLSDSVYVFERDPLDPKNWSQIAELQRPGEGFGASVRLMDGLLFVGAVGAGPGGGGAVYVYEDDAASPAQWVEIAMLTPSGRESAVNFGDGIDLQSNRAAIADPAAFNVEGVQTGAVYVFEGQAGNPSTWTEQAKLTPSDGEEFDFFGWSVRLEGDDLWVGSPLRNPTGAAYLFEKSAGTWAESTILAGFSFGFSLEVDATRVLVGAIGAGIGGLVHLFEETTDPIAISTSGTCPGPVGVTISNAPPNSEVGLIAAGGNGGFVKGGKNCNGMVLEISEPFQLPPVWVPTDGAGTGSGSITMQSNRCWLEGVELITCTTSSAVLVGSD